MQVSADKNGSSLGNSRTIVGVLETYKFMLKQLDQYHFHLFRNEIRDYLLISINLLVSITNPKFSLVIAAVAISVDRNRSSVGQQSEECFQNNVYNFIFMENGNIFFGVL